MRDQEEPAVSAGEAEPVANWTECCNMSPEFCDCANPKHIHVNFSPSEATRSDAAPLPQVDEGMIDPAQRFAKWQHEGEALAAAAGCSFTLKVRSPKSTWTITTPEIAALNQPGGE